MPLAQLKPRFLEDTASVAPPAIAANLEGIAAIASPARALQHRLLADAAPLPAIERWPLRTSAALIVTTSLALWMAILTAAAQAFHAIA